LLGDAYSFGSSLKQTIEHSGAGNDIPTDHVGVTYFYAEQPSSATVTPAAQRAVTDLRELVFPAGWQISIRAFPFLNTTLTKRAAKVGGEDVSYLSLRGGAPDWVGPAYLYVTCHVPTEGRYEIEIEALRGPEQGMVQLFQDEVPVGEPVDLFAETPARSGRVKLGVREMIAGDNPVMLKLVGKNERAQGLGLDLIQIVCRRLE
ncbi:MAG: hypothetical protein ACYC23_14325, partial [Limisphaerales bacterium]